MSTRKFAVGDRFRPAYVPASQPHLRLGRLLKIVEVVGCTHGGHCYYRAASRRGRPGAEIRSDRARTQEQRYTPPRGQRRAAKDSADA
jgi:hypothetical protein